jgi:hypothetical protein
MRKWRAMPTLQKLVKVGRQMKLPAENKVEKLGTIFRILSAFIFLVGILAAAGLAFFAIAKEPFQPQVLVASFVIFILLYVSGSVLFTGYAPKYLLFTHGPKKT